MGGFKKLALGQWVVAGNGTIAMFSDMLQEAEIWESNKSGNLIRVLVFVEQATKETYLHTQVLGVVRGRFSVGNFNCFKFTKNPKNVFFFQELVAVESRL